MRFTFNGFSLGSSVAISAAQYGNTASRSVAAWGQGTMGNVDILRVEGELIAPAPIWFEATDISGFNVPSTEPGEIYQPGFHRITFIWDFGESDPDLTFSAPLNIPTAWNDRNIAYGRRAAHVYRNPGTYTVTLWCVDSDGTVGQASTEVTIGSDAVFTGNRTLCFASDGNFTNAPSGAQQITTVDALRSAISGLSQSGQVLFRAGSETFDFSLSVSSSSDQNVRFGAWGSGARPIVRPPRDGIIFSFGQGVPVKERVFNGLDLRGSWDPTQETGGQDGPFNTILSDPADMLHLVHDCRLSGFDSVNLSTLKPQAFRSIISDSLIEDWYGYGFYANNQNDGVNDDSRMALIGTAIQQNPDACQGNIGEGYGLGMTTEQGPLRYESAKQFLIRCCYFFSNTTWSGDAQPCLRPGNRNQDGELILDRVVLEGGTNPLELQGVAGTVSGNFLCDRVLLLGTADTNTFVKTEFSGLTLRNIYGWMPDVPRNPVAIGAGHIVKLTSTGTLSDPVNVYNTSFVYLPAGGDVPFVSQTFVDNFSDQTVENNLIYAPNQNTPETADAPNLSASVPGVQPRYAGRRNSIRKPSTTSNGSSSTLVFSYPDTLNGATTLSASDFNATSGRHWVRNTSTGDRFYREEGDFTVSLGANITLSKTTGSWPSGTYRLGMDYLNHTTDPAGASPSSVPLPHPVVQTPPFETATAGYIAVDDFLMQRRPSQNKIPQSPVGDASKGSLEPI